MSVDDAALTAELNARHGVTTTERLARLGIGRRAIDTLKSSSRLVAVGRGVVATLVWPDTLERHMAIACAVTGGVICFPTAGVSWGMRKTPRCPDVHVWISMDRRIKNPPGIRVHRTRHLPACDVVRRPDGIVITSPPRTAFDASAWLSEDDLESLVEHGIDIGFFIIPTLQGISDRAGAPGRDGSGRFGAVLARRPAWRRPARSDHELRLERAMRARAFPELVREYRLVLLDGEVIHPDLGIPDDHFYVEVDHLTWHNRKDTSHNDRRRDLKARASGYHIERVTDIALANDLDATVDQLWTEWQRGRAA